MFAKTETPLKPGTFESLLGKGIEIKGTVRSKGSLRIEGSAEGNVECEGDVTVGETAVLNADVTAQNVTIGGTLSGTVTCSGRLELLPTARVKGDIKVGTLVVSEGAIFSGTTQMGEQAVSIGRETGEPKPEEE
ncbi:MAG: bactofilin family protein [Bacillota bacterium]|jgi:cytoskeletal protein CcmA (bactofilin family)|nr:polymer-forming cytoskeletal protein [Candidatus Fermentithermobacillaceae bacterium]